MGKKAGWAVILNKKTGYELTTVHHRPPKKLTATSSMRPNKAEGSSQAGSLKKRESSNYYPLPDDCWVCRDVMSACIRECEFFFISLFFLLTDIL